MRRLPVDTAELAAALDQPRRGPVRTFLDRTSGALEPMPRDVDPDGEFRDVLTAPARWVEIQPLTVAERQQLRRRFLEEVGDPYLRLRLSEALAGHRPFTRFDQILREGPPWLDAWLDFRVAALRTVARAWLSALGIEPL